MKNRKSQAALEFIMTYGWAILVVLVAIVALASFGVLSPDRFLPSKCTLQPGIGCVEFRIQDTEGTGGVGRILLRLTNGLGYDITVNSVNAVGCGPNGAAVTFANGETRNLEWDCAAPLTGSKFNGALTVAYTVTESGVAHTNLGQLVARLE